MAEFKLDIIAELKDNVTKGAESVTKSLGNMAQKAGDFSQKFINHIKGIVDVNIELDKTGKTAAKTSGLIVDTIKGVAALMGVLAAGGERVEKAFSEVARSARVANAPFGSAEAKRREQLMQGFLDVVKQVPESMEDIGTAMAEVTKVLGKDTPTEDIKEFTKWALAAKEALGITAADQQSILRFFGKDIRNADSRKFLEDLLNAATVLNKEPGGEGILKQLQSARMPSNFAPKELLALFTTMNEFGGSRAGSALTQLSTTLTDLQTNADDKKARLLGYGSADELKQDMFAGKSGLESIAKLVERLNAAGDQGMGIFGAEARRHLPNIINDQFVGRMRELVNLVNTPSIVDGALSKERAADLAEIGNKAGVLQNKLAALIGGKFGRQIAGITNDIMGILGNLTDQISSWLEKFSNLIVLIRKKFKEFGDAIKEGWNAAKRFFGFGGGQAQQQGFSGDTSGLLHKASFSPGGGSGGAGMFGGLGALANRGGGGTSGGGIAEGDESSSTFPGLNTPAGDSVVRQLQKNAVRHYPIKPALQNYLDFAAKQAGVDKINVISGLQDAAGRKRLGSSHRHDLESAIGAADVDLFKDGRRLSINNPKDRKHIEAFTRAFASVVPGAGVGAGYMGSGHRMHFGGPNTPGGKPVAYAGPRWFRDAFAKGRQQYGSSETQQAFQSFMASRSAGGGAMGTPGSFDGAVNFIKRLEGSKDQGWDIRQYSGPFGVRRGKNERLTLEQAEARMRSQFLHPIRNKLQSKIKVPINQGQENALLSYFYNLGPGKGRLDHAANLINTGRGHMVPQYMNQFVNRGTKYHRGLLNRRRQEQTMYHSGGPLVPGYGGYSGTQNINTPVNVRMNINRPQNVDQISQNVGSQVSERVKRALNNSMNDGVPGYVTR